MYGIAIAQFNTGYNCLNGRHTMHQNRLEKVQVDALHNRVLDALANTVLVKQINHGSHCGCS